MNGMVRFLGRYVLYVGGCDGRKTGRPYTRDKRKEMSY